jgi:hypothetical protein
MLKTGYVKSDAELQKITSYFKEQLPIYENELLDFREKLWLFKAHLWYSFLVQDFLSCYRYSKKWVELFHENPNMIQLNPVFYLKGNHYLLESLFFIKQQKKFKSTLLNLETALAKKSFPKDDNLEALSFLYLYSNKLNYHFLTGTFKEGFYLVDEILAGLKKFKNRIDEHHVIVFYYKIGCLYFGAGENKKCIAFLKNIIDNRTLKMREDLMCFSRVLSLIAHYEAGIDYNLDVQIRSTYKFLIKMNDLHEVQKEMIKFLRSLGDFYPQDLRGEFEKLYNRLKIYEDHPYEKRAFLYLDVLSWLESKIANKSVGQVIKEKADSLNR